MLLPAYRVLVRAAGCPGSGQESLYRYPYRRCGLAHRYPAPVAGSGQFQYGGRFRRRPKRRNERGHCDRRRSAAVPGSDGQVGAISFPCLAAGRHGRPHAGQRIDSRRYDGGRRRLSGSPGFPHLYRLGKRLAGGSGYRADYRLGRGYHCPSLHRLETNPGLLHHQPLGVDDVIPGRVGLHRRHIPPAGARLFQGTAVPGGGQRNARHRRTGHPQNGRPPQSDAGYRHPLFHRGLVAGRHPDTGRFLEQGRNPVSGQQPIESCLSGTDPADRLAQCLVYGPGNVCGLLRQVCRSPASRPRIPVDDDRNNVPAGRIGSLFRVHCL